MRKVRVVSTSLAFVGTSLALCNAYIGVDNLDRM